MPYVSSRGVIRDDQDSWASKFSLEYLTYLFWNVINYIVLFFKTMWDPTMTKKGSTYASSYRRSGGGDPPKFPRRRMGGIKHSSGPSPPPSGGGG